MASDGSGSLELEEPWDQSMSLSPPHIGMAFTYDPLQLFWNQAVQRYQEESGVEMVPDKWTSVRSTQDVVELLEDTHAGFKDYRHKGARLRKILEPVLAFGIQFSDIAGDLVGIVYPPATTIFSAVNHLLKSAKGVGDNYEAIAETFESASGFIARVKVLTPHDIPKELQKILVDTLIKVIELFRITEKQIREGGFKAFLKKFRGGKDEITSLSDEFKELFEEEERLVISLTYDQVYRQTRITELNDINGFLSYLRPKPFHEQARIYHTPGTGEWILQDHQYTEWEQKPGKAMWICGRPGTGKTVLFSNIVERLRSQCSISDDAPNYGNHGVGHFYCTVKEQRTLEPHNILGSLLMQLAWQCPYLPEPIMDLYRRRMAGPPMLSELVSALKDILLLFSDTYLLIDALDECTSETRDSLCGHLADILSDSQKHVHLLVVSRNMSYVQTGFHEDSMICLDLSSVQASISKDISVYIASSLKNLGQSHILSYVNSKHRDMIQETLNSKADGMFLWVRCQLKTLQSCISEEAVHKSLKILPTDLFDTYDQVLSFIHTLDNRQDIKLVLQWLAFAQRPLTPDELCEVLTIDISSGNASKTCIIPQRRPPNLDVLLPHCSNLVSLSDGYVSLSHTSVRDYLLSQRLSTHKDLCSFSLSLEDHQLLASRCLVYLLNSTTGMALWKYAKLYWHAHVNAAAENAENGPNNLLRELLRQFCLSKKAEEVEADLHHAVEHCDYKLAEILLEYGVDIEHRGQAGETPLQLASRMGILEMLELLLQHGADLRVSDHPHLHYAGNRLPTQTFISCGVTYELKFPACPHHEKNYYEGSLLQLAAANGHEHVVEALLSHCAEIHAHDGTPLHYIDWISYDSLLQVLPAQKASNALYYTIEAGHLNIFKALLSYKEIKINTSEQDGRTPLHLAAAKGLTSLVEALLLSGATQDQHGETPLHTALASGNESIAHALLLHGANVHARGIYGRNPLHLAADQGFDSVVKVLLSQGADVCGRDLEETLAPHTSSREWTRIFFSPIRRDEAYWRRTPLHIAAVKGFESIVGLLLSYRGDVYLNGNMPLLQSRHDSIAHALIFCHTDIHTGQSLEWTPLHLAAGADVYARDLNGETPLHAAIRSGNDNVVHALLLHSADIHAKQTNSYTPLHLAAKEGSQSLIEILLSRGADVCACDMWGKTPLHHAVKSGIAQALILNGADIHAQADNGLTSLHLAAREGYLSVVEALLLHGADVWACTNSGETPLHFASQSGQDSVVNALILRGADSNIHARREDGRTPLHLAARKGFQSLVEVLLAHGADVHSRARDSETPLHAAIQSGDDSTTHALILHGADINAQQKDGRTPLHLAARKGPQSLVEILLSRGADVYARANDGETPLHAASQYSRLDALMSTKIWGDLGLENTLLDANALESIVTVLMLHGADIHARRKDECTPLHLAVKAGSQGLVELLLSRGADVCACDMWGKAPLHYAGNSGVVQALILNGADINAREKNERTALHLAAREGYLSVVEALLSHGADVCAVDTSGQAPLHAAIHCIDNRIVDALILHGANVDARTANGYTALDIAIRNYEDVTDHLLIVLYPEPHDCIVESLLSHGTDINNRGEDGLTALERATAKGLKQIIKMLRREIEKRAGAAAETQNAG